MQVLGAAIDRIALRRRIFALPGLRQLRQRSVDRRIDRFTPPALRARSRKIVEELLHSGISRIDPDDFQSLLGENQKHALTALVERIQAGWRWPGPSPHLDREDVAKLLPSVFAIGSSDDLLDIVENYLGQECSYLTCALTLEAANGVQSGTRNWHTDIEDNRMLRILIYLNDVELGGGGFEHFFVEDTQTIVQELNYRSGYISDDSIGRAGTFKKGTEIGPAGTAIIFDGVRIIHRAGLPVLSDRISLTLTYTSRHPLRRKPTTRLESATRRRIEATLSDRQRAALI